MVKKPLYIGSEVSLTLYNSEECILSPFVRLIADENMAITNGEIVTTCIDVFAEETDRWIDCEYTENDEPTDVEYTEAGKILLGVSE